MAQSAQIAKVNHWHQRLADWLIANPARPMAEAAKHFGKTQTWISVVIHSDAFQDYFQKLSSDHSTSIAAKAAGVAGQALEALGERLEKEASILPVATLLEISDVMLKRVGGPASAAPGTAVQVNNYGVMSKAELEELRASMRNGLEKPQPLIEINSGAESADGSHDAKEGPQSAAAEGGAS